MMTKVPTIAVSLAAAAALAGCGGGSSSGPPKPAPTIPASCGATAGASATGNITLTSGQAVQLPALTYCTATFTVPANNTVAGGGLVTATVSLAAPPGLATPAPGNGTNGLASGNKPDTVLWLSLSPGAGVSLTSPTSPTISFTLYSLGTCSRFYLWNPSTTPGSYVAGTLSSATATFGGGANTTPAVFDAPEYAALACI